MSDSTNSSTPSTPNSTPATPSTLGTNASSQAAAAQAQKAQSQAKPTPQAPNTPATATSAPKQAAEAKAVINDPNASKAAKTEAKKTLKQLTIKIDGKESIESLPFEIPDTKEAREWMARELQMSRMGQGRAQYASDLEKEVRELVTQLQTDPFQALQNPAIKVDVKEAIKKYIEKEIEDSKKSPEQLENERLKAELKAERDAQQNDKKTREQQEQQALADKYEKEYDEQISQALETNQIPKSPAAVKKILAYAELAVAAGKDVSINDILPFVKEELINDYREHARALPDDALEEFFGKDLVDRLRKTAVRKAKQSQQNPALKAPAKVENTGKTTETPKEEKKVTYKQFFKPW